MIDEWSGLTDMLANLVEKYAFDFDIENLPDITGDNHAKDKRNKGEKLPKSRKMRLVNNGHKRYNIHDKNVQTIAR